MLPTDRLRRCDWWCSNERRTARASGALLAALLAIALAGCGESPRTGWARIEELTPAFLAERGARLPGLVSDGRGRVALTFVTGDNAMDAWVAISTDLGATFAPPQRLNRRPGAVAAFEGAGPAAAFGPEGRLAVGWVERREGAARAMDVVVAASGDGGASFAAPAIVNDDVGDAQETLHGFPTLAFHADGRLFAAWIDERENPPADSAAATSCLFAAWSPDGGRSWGENRLLSDRACPCCRLSAVVDDSGRVALAYRAGAGNRRDPALLLSPDGLEAAIDTLVADDGWILAGCPVEGVALAATAGRGTLAWFTGAEPPRVQVVPWRAGVGPAGVPRVLGDSLDGARRPQLARQGAVTWIGVEGAPRANSGRHVLAVRALEPGGALTPWCFLGASARDGTIAALDDARSLAAWSEQGVVRMVRLSRKSER